MNYFKKIVPIAIITVMIAASLNYPYIADDLKLIKLLLTFFSLCLVYFGMVTLDKFVR